MIQFAPVLNSKGTAGINFVVAKTRNVTPIVISVILLRIGSCCLFEVDVCHTAHEHRVNTISLTPGVFIKEVHSFID